MKQVILLAVILCAQHISDAQSAETGAKYLLYQKYASAENFFHQYLKSQPASDEAWLYLINSYILQNKAGKAMDSLAAAPATVLGSPHILIARGTLALAQNKKDSARIYFEKAMTSVKSKKSLLPALIAEAHVSSINGDINYATEVISNTLKKNKNNPWLYTLLGKCYRRLHDGSKSYQAFTTATQEDEKYADAFYELGKLFQTQKNKDMYLAYFTKAIAADRDFAPAYYELYDHYLYVDPGKAMAYFKDYLRLTDPAPGHDYAFADLLYLNKQYPDAIAHATELLERDSIVPRLHKLVAYSYAELGDTVKALTSMKNYFVSGNDSIFIAKDFETTAKLYGAVEVNQRTLQWHI